REGFDKVDRNDSKAYAQFFIDWALDRARAEKVNGIYTLIVKKPGRLQVIVGQETRKKAFTLDDRDKLVSLMLADFKNNQFDEGLLGGLDFIQKAMQKNLGGAAAAPSGELASRLADVKVERYVPAPAFSEGPTWKDGELFFCSNGLLRVTKDREVR